MEEKKKWTFMVYMAGDNDLDSAGVGDLQEMIQVGSTADVNIIAEFDRKGPTHHTKRYFVKTGELQEVEDLGETDCGDPNVLLNFLKWAAEHYEAERYAVVLWNHGSGWTPDLMDGIAQDVRAVNWNSREASQRSGTTLRRVLFRTTLEKILEMPERRERAICSDDGSGHSIDTTELGKVMVKARDVFGRKIDLLGMDACLMGNLEVAYQVQDYVTHIVASEDLEPNDGWPYDRVLQYLVENLHAETADLAAHIVKAYVQSYLERDMDGVTQSALDVSKIDEVTNALDTLSDVLVANMAQAKYWLDDSLALTQAQFYHETLYDIAEVSEWLGGYTHPDRDEIKNAPEPTRQAAEAIHKAATNVRKALYPQSKAFVIAEAHSGAQVDRCGGVTFYMPHRMKPRVSPFYNKIDYALEHRWDEMLEAYHKKPQPPSP